MNTPSLSAARRARVARLIATLIVPVALSACAEVHGLSGPNWGQMPKEQVALTKAEQCAIGYDMAQQVYKQIKVTGTVIKVSPKLGACGTYAVKYLRSSGYGVDETAKKPELHQFAIATYEDPDSGGVFATTHLPNLRLTRAYRRGETGVYPLTPVDVVRTEAF